MKILITESQFKKILNEDFSNREKTIRAAYELIVKGSHGLGTDPDDIIKGLKMLKNKEDFYRLNGLFSDGRSDYKSFADMINGEFDYGNFANNRDDLVSVCSELSRIEVGFSKANSSSFPYWPVLKTDTNKNMSPIEDYNQSKKDEWDDFPQRTVSNYCRVVAQNAMNRAKKWWMDHLNSSVTKQNFISTYLSVGKKFTTNEVNNIFSNYKNMVNKIEYRLYDDEYIENYPGGYPKESSGYAPPEDTSLIYLNCYNATDNDSMYGTAVHEIQHQLFEYYPLAPQGYMSSIRGDRKNWVAGVDTRDDLYPNELLGISRKYGISLYDLQVLFNKFKIQVKNTDDQGYRCRDTEQISRVEKIRASHGFKEGEKFTISRIKPLFRGGDVNFDFLMYCWFESGMPDLEMYFNGLSGIAMNNQKNNPNNEPNVQNV